MTGSPFASRLAAGRVGVAQRGWLVLVGAGMAFFVAHTGFGFGGPGLDDFASNWIYDSLEVLAVVAVSARAVTCREERSVWALLALGLGCWTLGDISWTVVYADNPPFPSAADAFYLAFYPPTYLALALLVRRRLSHFNTSVWLDGLSAALAVAALGAAVLLDVVLHATHGRLFAEAVNLAYPLGDIVLVAFVVGVFAVTGWRPGAGWLAIGGALTISVVADGVYLYQSAVGAYTAGTILDALWPAALILLALAAWTAPGRRRDVRLEGRPLAAAPLLCSLIAIGVLVDSYVQRRNPVGVALAAAAIVTVVVRAMLTFRENVRMNERMHVLASTDALTGLANRRRLIADLDELFERGSGDSCLFALYDLNGFKGYNDTFGHPTGDTLLARLAARLELAVGGDGSCYRLGGDEFCVVAALPASEFGALLDRTIEALSERGEGFDITTAFGCAILPDEASSSNEALRVADKRLYAQKAQTLITRGRPHAVLLQALAEREPALRAHVGGVAELSLCLAEKLDLTDAALEELGLAAQLHDIGKLAIPDSVLGKTEALDEHELAFIRSHTVVGQRILEASPALSEVGRIVRATHERWDGTGYPDGLAGTDIPLPARVIAVCDVYSAMTERRPHGRVHTPEGAREELRASAGTQLDPGLVELFCELEPSAMPVGV